MSAESESHLKNLDALLREPEVLIVCGSGGVGKTTLAASLSLRAAALGRKVATLTIDPARRLADSLGVRLDGDSMVEVKGAAAGSSGRMMAQMLDAQRTFDELIGRHASSPENAREILENRIYKRLSAQVAGTQEYMAMEKLYALRAEKAHDLIVLDTPPARHAIDFITAPERVGKVLDHSSLKWLVSGKSESWLSKSLVTTGLRSVAKKLDSVLGMDLLRDIIAFFKAFEGMYPGFKERSSAVDEVLRSKRCAFVVVTSPEDNPLEEARFFIEELKRLGMPLRAVFVNRFHLPIRASASPDASLTGHQGRREQALRLVSELASADQRRSADALASLAAELPVFYSPRFEQDVCDLEGLRQITARLRPGDRRGPSPR